eukprot:Nitzschia sp. Nitz4//scaffold18_size181773//178945//179922//NITZ4_001948-RA/size181773-processed-gene-0.75-mRNA-1//-1//CDS//3329540110//6306//frame0
MNLIASQVPPLLRTSLTFNPLDIYNSFPITSVNDHHQHHLHQHHHQLVGGQSTNQVQERATRRQSTNNHSANSSKIKTLPLPGGYQPGPKDVICGRGAKAKNHSGNLVFKKYIQQFIGTYSDAQTKLEKSVIVTNVIDSIQGKGGIFVKELEKNEWAEVGDELKRDKIGQAFRDALHGKYRSSTKAKRRRWKQEEKTKQGTSSPSINMDLGDQPMEDDSTTSSTTRTTTRMTTTTSTDAGGSESGEALHYSSNPLDKVVNSHAKVAEHNKFVQASLLRLGGSTALDSSVSKLFDAANKSLLALIKNDDRLQGIATTGNKELFATA